MGYSMMLGKSGLDAAQRAVSLGRECGLEIEVAMGLLYSGIALARLGRYAEADVALGDAVARLRDGGSLRSLLVGLISQATIATNLGRADAARELYEQALALQRDTVLSHSVVVVRANLALLEFSCGNRARALELGREAVELSRALSDASLKASLLVNLAAFLIDDRQYDAARVVAREALEIANERRYAVLVCIAIEHLSLIAALKGDLRTPARLIGYTDAAMQQAGFVRELTEQRGYDELRRMFALGLGAADLAELCASGQALSEPEAVDLARDLIG
jgi:tetratricopeptide (TPR) repeat protein